ncbi:C40 family peptidase [Mycobacterium sp. NPDC003449]
MPGATFVSALAAPLHELRALVGPGWPAHDAPVTALADAGAALADVATAVERTRTRTSDGWSGAAASTAEAFTEHLAATAAALADEAGALGAGARRAGAAVAAAGARIQAIVDGFEALAARLEPHLDEPGVAGELLAEARRSLREATAVIDELRAELDRQEAAISRPPAASAAPTVPAGYAAGPGAWTGGSGAGGSGSGVGASAGGDWQSSGGGWSGGHPAGAEPAGFSIPDAAVALRDPAMFGEGVAVRLPDGTSVLAPNSVAAGAVRHALTQLGVPYRWGGTSPGVGLDCSGLTQWAYHEAGLNIPRLAQEQDIGAAVGADALRPGDLAVWDGHVAMVVSSTTMIEAGDPVQLSPIRTTNAGQGFQGFWRPTA